MFAGSAAGSGNLLESISKPSSSACSGSFGASSLRKMPLPVAASTTLGAGIPFKWSQMKSGLSVPVRALKTLCWKSRRYRSLLGSPWLRVYTEHDITNVSRTGVSTISWPGTDCGKGQYLNTNPFYDAGT